MKTRTKIDIIGYSMDAGPEDWEEDLNAEDQKKPVTTNHQNKLPIPHQRVIDLTNKSDDTKHFKMYKKMYNFFSFLGKFYGVEMSYNWQPIRFFRWWMVIIVAILSWSCILYTQAIHIHNGDIMRALEPCATYGVATSAILKIYGYLKNRNFVISLFYAMAPICRKNISGIRADIIQLQFPKTFCFLKLFACGLFSCVFLFGLSPICVYILKGEIASLLPIEIFFIDQSTTIGFVIANIIMITMGLYAIWGTVMYTSSFIVYIFNYSMLAELIRQDFKDLDIMWMGDSILSNSYKRAYLKNICKKCQDMQNYLQVVKDIYDMKLFIYFCFNYFSQIICLFEIALNDWMPGYAIALTSFVEMMFYCFMGSNMPIANERLCGIICETNWYAYDIESQRMILMLLHKCQHFESIRLGPIGPLDLVTGIEIGKSIFSYYTVLKGLF